MPQGRLGELLAGCFGIAAAILLVGGWILVRIQRDRQQFRLMQTALERGITVLPGMAPGWIMSLRQGVMALALGAGMLVMGNIIYKTADQIDAIPAGAGGSGAMTQPGGQMALPGRPPSPPPQDHLGPPGGHDRQPRGGPDEHDMQPPEPLHQNPAMERWHHVQSQRVIGQVGIFAGGILTLLGLMRIVFAFVEKKYATTVGGGKV